MGTEAAARAAIPDLLSGWEPERARLDRIDDYLRGVHPGPYRPREANREYRLLEERATTNWMQLVVGSVAQALYVDGYRPADGSDNATPWAFWQANGLDHRQAAVHNGALSFGASFVSVLPSDSDIPAIRGVSPRKLWAVYDDPAEDDFPIWAIRVEGVRVDGKDALKLRVYDDTTVHTYRMVDGDGGKPTVEHLVSVDHGVGEVPIVRFVDQMDLEGRYTGQIEPVIPIQDRINQTAFDLLMTQTFASFKIRWASGMTLPDDDDEARAAKLRMGQDRLVVAEDPDTKFGAIDETPLDGFISSLDQSVRHLAAITQTPPHHLLGQMANLSAEALAAAEMSLTRKVDGVKQSFGESWERVFRLAASVAGDSAAASDQSAQVVWRDTQSRSLAATADALGKMGEMLSVPKRALWEMIPGVTQQDVERWQSMATEDDAMASLTALLDRQADA